MRPLLRAGLILSIIVFIIGCGDDSPGPTDVSPGNAANATLAVGGIQSLGRVDVKGLPAAKANAADVVYRAVLTADGAGPITLILDQDPDGWFFIAPVHPVNPNTGGGFSVRITDGASESAALDLEVAALPEAPGAFAGLVATMREHLEQRAGAAGTSIAALKATPEAEVAPALLALKLAQSYLDSDGDPHDLTGLAANEDGFLSAEQAELMDRMFGYFELESMLRREIGAYPAGELSARRPAGKGHSADTCFDVGPDITTAPELSVAMIRSAVAEFASDPDSDAGRILDAGATLLSGLSVVPELGVPAGAAGAVIGAVQAVKQAEAGILPTYFVSITCDLDKSEFNEDSTGSATYSNVKVVAASRGWSADQSIANVAINVLGGYLSFVEEGQILGSEALRDIGVFGLGHGAAGVFGDTGIIEFCGRQWTVDISSPLYCTAASLGHKFDVDIEGQRVTPREEGPDQLRVAAQATRFGNREIHLDLPMRVKRIIVAVTPGDITVTEPGETVMINAGINNADLTTLRWTTAWGNWEDGIGEDTNDGRARPLRTPADPDAYPFLVSVESLSRNGARSTGEPPRVGFATIRFQDSVRVHVEPQYVCIQPGATQQFTATVTGLENYTVVWSIAEGYGSIDQNGLYQSLGEGTSNAVVVARLEEDPDKFDEAALDAAACNCSIDVVISGDANWQRVSSQAAYLVSDLGGTLFYQFFLDFDNDGAETVSVSIAGDGVPSPRPGDTGTWPAGFTFISGDQSWVSIWDDLPLPGVMLNLTELTETYMVGSFTGNAFQLDENGDIASVIAVDMKFRAGLWDFGEWPCH